MISTFKKIVATVGVGAALLAPAVPAFAQGLQPGGNPFQAGNNLAGDVANKSGIAGGSTDPIQIVGRIINVILSLLGLIFLILVLYAGFLWMTAQGDDKKVGQAKSIIQQAIVGLIVIMAGYAISNFVLSTLANVTQG